MFFFDVLTQEQEEYAFKKQAGVKPITRYPMTWRSYYECGNCGIRIGDINHNYCTSCGFKILWSSPRCLTGYPDTDKSGGSYKYLPDEEALQSRRRCAIRAMCGAAPGFTQGIKGIANDSFDCGFCGAVAKVQDSFCWKCGIKHLWTDAISILPSKRKSYYTQIRDKL